MNNMFKLIILFASALACHGFAIPEKFNGHVGYLVYRRASGTTPVTMGATFGDVKDFLDTTVPAVILVHGHEGTGLTSLNPVIIRAMFNAGQDVNIVVVNWADLASGSYTNAVNAVPYVSSNLRDFIGEMDEELVGGIQVWPVSSLHIVGFNLGAHIAGIAARRLQNRVARITGLDPSGSRWGSSSDRLRESDARYVEVIHTDGGKSLFSNGIGEAIGSVDFFANGGNSQPGCYSHTCCHERAYELFAASFSNPRLVGNRCTSSLQISLNTCRGGQETLGNNSLMKNGSGSYRINTGRSFPF